MSSVENKIIAERRTRRTKYRGKIEIDVWDIIHWSLAGRSIEATVYSQDVVEIIRKEVEKRRLGNKKVKK